MTPDEKIEQLTISLRSASERIHELESIIEEQACGLSQDLLRSFKEPEITRVEIPNMDSFEVQLRLEPITPYVSMSYSATDHLKPEHYEAVEKMVVEALTKQVGKQIAAILFNTKKERDDTRRSAVLYTAGVKDERTT